MILGEHKEPTLSQWDRVIHKGPRTQDGRPVGSKPVIDVRDLTKCYGKITAVNSISFQVFQGDIFGLVGLNGAGKTTTIMMLSSLLNPDSGSATVCGYDMVKERDGVRLSRNNLRRTKFV